MPANFGSGITLIDNRWTAFKALFTSKSLSSVLQYVDDGMTYNIFAFDGPTALTCTIWKGTVPDGFTSSYSQAQNDTDKTDFETNFKPNANAKISTPVSSASTSSIVFNSGTITATGSTTITGLGVKDLSILINIKNSPTGTTPSITFTVQDIDPIDLTTVMGTAVSGAAMTASGVQEITYTAISSAVKVTWTVTGTTPSFTGVNLSVVQKAAASSSGGGAAANVGTLNTTAPTSGGLIGGKDFSGFIQAPAVDHYKNLIGTPQETLYSTANDAYGFPNQVWSTTLAGTGSVTSSTTSTPFARIASGTGASASALTVLGSGKFYMGHGALIFESVINTDNVRQVTAGTVCRFGFGDSLESGGGITSGVVFDVAANVWSTAIINDSTRTVVTTLATPTTGVLHKFKIVVTVEKFYWYIDDVLVSTYDLTVIANNALQFRRHWGVAFYVAGNTASSTVQLDFYAVKVMTLGPIYQSRISGALATVPLGTVAAYGGSNTIGGLSVGKVATAAVTTVPVGNSYMPFNVGSSSVTVVSTSGNDTNASLGANSVSVLGYTNAGAVVSAFTMLNGTTPVTVVFPGSPVIVGIEVFQVGGGNAAAGTITCKINATVVATIAIGDYRAYNCIHYVESARTCFVNRIQISTNGVSGYFRVLSQFTVSAAPKVVAGNYRAVTGSNLVEVNFDPPLTVSNNYGTAGFAGGPLPTAIWVQVIPDAVTAGTAWAQMSWMETT